MKIFKKAKKFSNKKCKNNNILVQKAATEYLNAKSQSVILHETQKF